MSNMFERFTDHSRKVMALANQEAQRLNHEFIGTEHILLGMVKEGTGTGATVLKRLGIDLRRVRPEVEKLVKSGSNVVSAARLPLTPEARNMILHAVEESRELGHDHVDTEHMLLGLLDQREGLAARVLVNLGLKPEQVREEMLNMPIAGDQDEATSRGGQYPDLAELERAWPQLDPALRKQIVAIARSGRGQDAGKSDQRE